MAGPPVYHYVSSSAPTPKNDAPEVDYVSSTQSTPQAAATPVAPARRLASSRAIRDTPTTPTPGPTRRKFLGPDSTLPVMSPSQVIAALSRPRPVAPPGIAFNGSMLSALTDIKPRSARKTHRSDSLEGASGRDTPKRQNLDSSAATGDGSDLGKAETSDTLPLYADGDSDDSDMVIPHDKPAAKKNKRKVVAKAPKKKNVLKGKAKEKTAAPVLEAPVLAAPSTSSVSLVAQPAPRNASSGPSNRTAAPQLSKVNTSYKILTARPFTLRTFRDVGVNTSPFHGRYDDDEGVHSDASSGYGSLGFDTDGLAEACDLADNPYLANQPRGS